MCVAGAKRGKARVGVSRLVWSSLVDDSLWYSQTTVTLFVCQSTCDWRFRFPRELRSRRHRSTLQPESDKKTLNTWKSWKVRRPFSISVMAFSETAKNDTVESSAKSGQHRNQRKTAWRTMTVNVRSGKLSAGGGLKGLVCFRSNDLIEIWFWETIIAHHFYKPLTRIPEPVHLNRLLKCIAT